jgi:metal-sulfur cluster biosynthetic enzyme
MTVDNARVLDALSGVRDPELDDPITELGFVSDLKVEGEAVNIRLRLPTYFCAPNFAYLMVADAKDAVLSVPGIESASVVLDDHYASGEINVGVNGEHGFDGAFPNETESPDLEELRTVFRRKSFVSRQEQLCRELLAEGNTPSDLAWMTLAEVPASDSLQKYLERRAALGLDISGEAPLVVDPQGKRIPEDAVVQHLRFARTVRVSIEGNAELCTGLLAARYGIPEREEKTA